MMSDITTSNPWQQLSAKANKMSLPTRATVTRDGVYGRKRPDPEIIEHMLDDLESKMRNYFLLYNREREFRQQAEKDAYRLEQEIVNYQQKLDESNHKLHCLENKIKSMIDQPLKLKETIEKIDILYTQMDTLVQAFVGIGSCAVIQGYSRVAFIKLCLEYLFPCRELDIRLNTLYNALYSVLLQYDGMEITANEVMKPISMEQNNAVLKPPQLQGIALKVHRVMLKCDLPTPEPTSYGCLFRYDNEPKSLIDTNKSRLAVTNVKPLDNASKVYEFNSTIEIAALPPKIPNVIPKLMVDIYSDGNFIGTADANIISDKTLKPGEPWNILDSNGVYCGDVVVTVLPIPCQARLPATNFANKQDELMKVATEHTQKETPRTQVVITPRKEEPKDEPKKSEPVKQFEPKKNANFRKPLLFNGKATVAKPAPPPKKEQDPASPKPSNSMVTKLAKMFGKKMPEEAEQNVEAKISKEEVKADPPAPVEESHATIEENKKPQDEPSEAVDNSEDKPSEQENVVIPRNSIKDMIIKKLTRKFTAREKTEEPVLPKENAEEPKEEPKAKALPAVPKVPKPLLAPPKPKDQPAVPKTKAPEVKKAPSQPMIPAPKVIPKAQVEVSPPKVDAPVSAKLPTKPLVPIVIAPKLLKKPSPPKKL
ncbi:hypothetical protein BEWA_020240 [Theileria equi strain WA]|uniref:Uncharacterized protein n=1 Tax=Theileria equi strain WA TaxID=1537102 RepID=L0AVA2_THEEQ|nr:hypothetical protein BEWA_020240 [Theileria equi strain WA]AFZ79178.1 hypothetical protein BEWA_020240 [Theileria equi strain WA]|eukprot:XP_004828844.1 hypothetical protein BEWA_020240 [Theileria equi strain WA]